MFFFLKKTVGVLHYMFLAMFCKETDLQYLLVTVVQLFDADRNSGWRLQQDQNHQDTINLKLSRLAVLKKGAGLRPRAVSYHLQNNVWASKWQ